MEATKKKKAIIIFVVLIIALALLAWWIISTTEANRIKANEIENNFVGKAFTRKDEDYSEYYDKHSLGYRSTTETTLKFNQDGTTIKYNHYVIEYNDYYKSHSNVENKNQKGKMNWGDYHVSVSVFGTITLTIGTTDRYTVKVDDSNTPISFGSKNSEFKYAPYFNANGY